MNVLQVINYTLTDLLKVTVELRHQSASMHLGSDTKPPISMYFDVGLSIALLISTAIGASVKNNSWGRGGIWNVGHAFAWVVM